MAGGGKVSPRQKMINMMYLVLTAMLALNVSAEILKAFYLVEQSMVKAGANVDAKNTDILAMFAKQEQTQAAKVKPFHDKAKEAHKITEDFVKYVEDLKVQIVTNDGKISPEEAREIDEEGQLGQLKAKDNIERHANLLVAPSGPQKGAELKTQINDTRDRKSVV